MSSIFHYKTSPNRQNGIIHSVTSPLMRAETTENSEKTSFVSPTDITHFLVWKDRHRETVVESHCSSDSKRESEDKCKCSKRHEFITNHI